MDKTSQKPAPLPPSPIEFRCIGAPEAQPRPRVFRNGGVLSEKTAFFSVVHGEALQRRPPEPMDCPVLLTVSFIFARPKYASDEILKATKPDIDNLLKSVMDALTLARWWTDDGRVAEVRASKRWALAGESPGAVVRAAPLPR